MFTSLLVANRGEIACRIIRTARRMGIRTIAIYSDADRNALHVSMADEAIHIGPSPSRDSYLNIERIVAVCRATGAAAVHPGYGFLSENPAFARALDDAGIVFVGPPADAIAAMGDKIASKKIAAAAGVATVPGHPESIADADEGVRIARQIGYPVMIKASAGGGGKGMRIAHDDAEAREGFERAQSEAAASFGDDRIFIEKFVTEPRHIEIQVLADAHGNVIHLGERECSIQRRHQKIIEEAPSPFLDASTREQMGAAAVTLAKAVGYRSAGTVEFIVDRDRTFYFLEMNTRLQVEHPVTELVTGIDIVEWMLRVAAGDELSVSQRDVRLTGWAMESRVYAEDPYRGFLPSTGRLTRYRPSTDAHLGDDAADSVPRDDAEVGKGEPRVRNDTGVAEGTEVSPFYDPMLAKLCTWAPDRQGAIDAMADALDAFEIEGVGHNLPFLSTVIGQQRFRDGQLTTGYLAEEFPQGFSGASPDEETLRRIAAFCAAAGYALDSRAFDSPGDARGRPPEAVRVVVAGGRQWCFQVGERDGVYWLEEEGSEFAVETDWSPGDTVARARVDGKRLTLKVGRSTLGLRIRHRGADLEMKILAPRVAALLPLMPVKAPPDLSRFLLCPMPGQVVRVDVRAGDVVEAGQPLAVVEAMKMENVLKAQRRARVASVRVAPGAVLAADEVMLEFEAA